MVEYGKQNDIEQEYDGKNDIFQKFRRVAKVCFEVNSYHGSRDDRNHENDNGGN